jgi:hypothetical protein
MLRFIYFRHLLSAAGVTAVLLGANGCSGPAGPVPQARVTAAQQAAIPRDSPTHPGPAAGMKSMQAAVDQAVDAVHQGAPVFIAHAMILANTNEAGSATIRTDQVQGLSAGSYLLVAFCAGSGRVTARLSVGKATAHLTVACRTAPEPIRLSVRAPKGGDGTVQLAALDRQPVAVAYVLKPPADT